MDKQIRGAGIGEVVPGVSYRPSPICYPSPVSAALLLAGASVNAGQFYLARAILESSQELQDELETIAQLNAPDYTGLTLLTFASIIQKKEG